MISALRSSSVVVCVCCIVCAMFSMIAPAGKMKKTVDIVLSLFLLSSMLIPIASFVKSFSADVVIDEQDVDIKNIDEDDYTEIVLKQTADNLVEIADNLLKSEGIQAENIRVSLKKTDKNSIYISRIDIYISKDNEKDTDKIKRIVETNMSKEPGIYIDE